jgi:hypothetical protein
MNTSILLAEFDKAVAAGTSNVRLLSVQNRACTKGKNPVRLNRLDFLR